MRVWSVIVFIFLPILLFGRGEEGRDVGRFEMYLERYLATFPSNTSVEGFTEFLDKLESKRESRNDTEFLRYIFTKVHNRFLKHYGDYAPFSALFQNGSYNCLTGTALYALLLDHFGFDYQIIETNYHIFLLAKVDNSRVLIEATDPQYGFITNEKAIAERIKLYRQNENNDAVSRGPYYQFKFELYNDVDLNELTGLLYYNLAVDAFNKQEIDRSVDLLDQAMKYYESERIQEFSKVILLTILHSDLENTAKQLYVNKVRRLRTTSRL